MPSGKFRTSSTPLAAYLISEGFIIESTIQENGKVFFLFEDDNETFAKCVRDYELGRAMGNIAVFFNAYRSLLKQVHAEIEDV